MQELFTRLAEVLATKDMRSKHMAFLDLYEDFLSHKLALSHDLPLESIAPYTHAPIKPAHHIKQGRLGSSTSIARALHAIAHIEYSAITLALDSAYRFRYLPYAYYADWLKVAEEEFRHFFLLEELLMELGAHYGSFAVHSNLYSAMIATNASLLYRMGVVHRGLEARGLDANPFVAHKFAATKHPISPKVDEVLQCILRDEIGHVSKGDRWWRFALECVPSGLEHRDTRDSSYQACKDSSLPQYLVESLQADVQALLEYVRVDMGDSRLWDRAKGLESSFLDSRAARLGEDDGAIFLALCVKFADFSLCGKIPNTSARLQCGFSEREITQLERLYALRPKSTRIP